MLDKQTVAHSLFIKQWIEDNVIYFKRLYPHAPEEHLREILIEVAESHGENPRAVIHNDYNDDMIVNTDLLTLYDWVNTNKPICAGNGTFFNNQNKASSPISKVILGRIGARKRYQVVRDEYVQDTYEYQYYDMMQQEAKIKINSIYGSFGATTFQFYNLYTAASTTGTAQSLISTTAISFEAFLSDNAKFRNIDEFMIYIGNILDKDDYSYPIYMVPLIRDRETVVNRLFGHFLTESEKTIAHKEVIEETLRHCSTEELTRIYYKNNIYAFMSTPLAHKLLLSVFNKTESFRNPNKVPAEIVDDLTLLWDYCSEFVFYNHAYTERINRLNHDKRQSVIVIDTDSNMINVEPWVRFLKENVWESSCTTMDENDKTFASVNIIAFLITKMLKSLLAKYCADCNVLPEMAAEHINMKNEFYYGKMLLADSKKRYSALTKLQEGKEIKEGSKKELDVKGYDFRKAGVSEDISNKLYSILLECIMRPTEISISRILSKLNYIENDIRNSLKQGKRTYLLRMNCKVPKAYAKPETQGAVLSVNLWNIMYPDNEISVPDKLDIVILNSVPLEQFETLEDEYPDMVERVRRYLFNGPQADHFRKKGLVYLALPNDGSDIPKCIIPFINVDKIITRNIGTFEPVMKALNVPMVSGGNDYKYFGNTLDI